MPATNSVGAGGPNRWRYLLSASYNAEAFSISLTERGISSGVYNNDYVQCETGCPISTPDNRTININYKPGAWYTDLSLTYHMMHQEDDGVGVDLFMTVQNLLNKGPVLIPAGGTPGGNSYINAPTDGSRYDAIGRMLRAGLRFTM